MKHDAEAAQCRRGAATRMRMDEKRPLRDQVFDERGAPLVTVFVPTYNHARFISQCLEAILDQVTDFSVEIIVNDDASTDETPVILQSYQQRYPALFRCHLQKTNLLHAHRRFEGRLHGMARGAYMAQCDGDDYWRDPDKLQKQVDFLEGHPEYVMSFHDAIEIDVHGRLLRPHHLSKAARRDYTADELRCLKWGWMLTQSMVYRKAFDEFPPEYFLAPNEDNFLPILLGRFGAAKYQVEVEPLAYRQHPGGIWSQQSFARRSQMHFQSYLQIVAYLVRIGEMQTAKKLVLGRLIPYLNQYFSAGHKPATAPQAGAVAESISKPEKS
jgi:glycosyltransferase involved in cell wall biosynthesis